MHDTTKQDNTRQYKPSHNTTRQDNTMHCTTKQDKTTLDNPTQSNTRQFCDNTGSHTIRQYTVVQDNARQKDTTHAKYNTIQ